MAQLASYSAEDLRNAKKAGFKAKKPKKPKAKTHASLTGYVERYNDWVKRMKETAKKGKELKTLREQIRRV